MIIPQDQHARAIGVAGQQGGKLGPEGRAVACIAKRCKAIPIGREGRGLRPIGSAQVRQAGRGGMGLQVDQHIHRQTVKHRLLCRVRGFARDQTVAQIFQQQEPLRQIAGHYARRGQVQRGQMVGNPDEVGGIITLAGRSIHQNGAGRPPCQPVVAAVRCIPGQRAADGIAPTGACNKGPGQSLTVGHTAPQSARRAAVRAGRGPGVTCAIR